MTLTRILRLKWPKISPSVDEIDNSSQPMKVVNIVLFPKTVSLIQLILFDYSKMTQFGWSQF